MEKKFLKNFMKGRVIGIIVILVLILGYYLVSPLWRNKALEESMPERTAILSEAAITADAHEVAGKALLLDAGGHAIVRFENLETINGPDLRIYLSSGLDVSDAIDLGPIKATHGSVNYEVPPGTDLSKYRHVLIWCRAFRVLFSHADL